MTLFSTGVTASAARGSIERSGATGPSPGGPAPGSGPRLSGRNERRRRSGTTTSWYQTRPDPAGARSRPSPQRTRVPLPNHTLSARQLGGRSPTTRRRGVDLAAPAAVGQRDADPLGDADQRHAPERVAPVAPLVARGAAAGDQLLPFVEMQRRDGHPTARGELPDRQLRLVPGWLVHAAWLPARPQLWFRF